VGGQAGKDRIQSFEMILVRPRVYDQIIDIDHHVVYTFYHLLHEPLEGGGGGGQTHGHHLPFELPHPGNRESRVGS